MRLARIISTRYLFCEKPLDQGGLERLYGINYRFSDGAVKGTSLLSGASRLLRYRKNIGDNPASLDPLNNYIYRIDKPLRVYNRTVEDTLFALKMGMVDVARLEKEYPGKTPEEAIQGMEYDEGPGILNFFFKKPFTDYFDGIQLENKLSDAWGCVATWMDIIKVASELVDGNGLRFVKESPLTVAPEIPTDVMVELVKYCSSAGGNIGTESRKWLRENLVASSVKVYRGIALEPEDARVKDLNAVAKKYLGVADVTGVHRGAEVKLSRGKASSWSKTPQISREFSSFGDIRVLVQAELTPKQIIADLTLLPLDTRMKLFHFSQNEVIAMPGKISAKIIGVNVTESILKDMLQQTKESDPEWLRYAWVPQYGIVLKSKVAAARVLSRYLGFDTFP